MLIVVRAVVILDVEDSLALATSGGAAAPSVIMSPPAADATSVATCEIFVETVRIVVPEGEASRARSYVTGPPTVGSRVAVGDGGYHVVAANGGAVAICRYTLLIDSVIIAGGGHGLPSGPTAGPVLLSQTPSTVASAHCDARIGKVEIVEVPIG